MSNGKRNLQFGLNAVFCASVSAIMVLMSATVLAVEMPSIFSDGMVIQRETRAPVWGWAEPGEKVEVTATWGASAEATADKDGKWSLKLQTPQAGGPFQVSVNEVVIKDVLVGEVWLCSGQSNMDCNLKFFTQKAREKKYQPIVEYIRKEVETAADPLLRQITVSHHPSPLEKRDDFKGNWFASKPQRNGDFTGTGYFFGRELRRELNVPIGLIKSAWGGTRVQPWIPETAYRDDPEMNEYYEGEMEEVNKKLKQGIKEDSAKFRQYPSVLYKGMIAPIHPYAVRGVIWYQGESNTKYMPDSYQKYFQALIKSWRDKWGQSELPFYWAQLAGWNPNKNRKRMLDNWPSICDQQRRVLQLPNTGMAVLNDIGEAEDIHPRNKIDVGRRLALWALAKDYSVDVPAFSGPLYKSHQIKNGKVLIEFDHAGSGLMAGEKELLDDALEVDEPLKTFEIAGNDGEWRVAEAGIVSQDTVKVEHPEVEQPVAVRYAWDSNPVDANLYNKEGLPASVFTTRN